MAGPFYLPFLTFTPGVKVKFFYFYPGGESKKRERNGMEKGKWNLKRGIMGVA